MHKISINTFITSVKKATILAIVGVFGAAILITPVVSADTAPPSGTPATVSADVLPTAQIDGVVWDQVTVGNKVYATGKFSKARPAGVALGGAGTVTRAGLLAYDIRTGVLDTTFVHSLGGSSSTPCMGSVATGPQGCGIAASPDGTMLYVGGTFSTVDGQPHANIAAFNLTNNTLVSGFQGVNNKVKTLAATNSGVYIGGSFSAAGGASRGHLAYFNKSGTLNTAWNATLTGSVSGMVVAKNKLIFAGSFTAVNGKKFWSNAAVSLTTGASITPWASQNDSFPIHAIDPTGKSGTSFTGASTDGSQVYLTSFTYITKAADRLHTFEGRMAINPDTGALIWMDDCVGDSYDSFPIGQVLYSSGHMHGCAPRDWMPDNPGKREYHHAVAETTYKTGTNVGDNGGAYPSYNGQPAATILNWFPTFSVGTATGMSQAGWSVTGNSSYVAYGGEFLKVSGVAQQGLVRFAIKGLAPNKVGPQAYPAGYGVMAYPADSAGKSLVRVYATGDADNGLLKYDVYRKGSSTVLATKTVDSRFWKNTSWTFNDTGLTPGTSADYKLVVTDPLGNARTMDNANVINDTDARMKYAGSGWVSSQSRPYKSPDFARGIHYSKTNGASYSLTMYGSSFKIIGEKNSGRGNISVSIDGGTPVTASAYSSASSANTAYQQTIYQSGTLGLGKHTVKVTKSSGTYMDVDAIYVAQDKAFDDTSSAFKYTTAANWKSRTNSTSYDDYGKSLHYSSVNGASYTVTFSGTSFALMGEKTPDRGNISVSIDGGTAVTVNTHNATKLYQQNIYSKSGLSSGSHTLTVKKLSGTNMDVDALFYR